MWRARSTFLFSTLIHRALLSSASSISAKMFACRTVSIITSNMRASCASFISCSGVLEICEWTIRTVSGRDIALSIAKLREF